MADAYKGGRRWVDTSDPVDTQTSYDGVTLTLGDIWINTTDGTVHVCDDPAAGSWLEVQGSEGGGGGGGGWELYDVPQSDVIRTSDATPYELATVSLGIGAWAFEGVLWTTSPAAPDMRYGVSFDGTASAGWWCLTNPNTSATVALGTTQTVATGNVPECVRMAGIVIVTVAGDLHLLGGQASANGAPTTLHAGSHIRAWGPTA